MIHELFNEPFRNLVNITLHCSEQWKGWWNKKYFYPISHDLLSVSSGLVGGRLSGLHFKRFCYVTLLSMRGGGATFGPLVSTYRASKNKFVGCLGLSWLPWQPTLLLRGVHCLLSAHCLLSGNYRKIANFNMISSSVPKIHFKFEMSTYNWAPVPNFR